VNAKTTLDPSCDLFVQGPGDLEVNRRLVDTLVLLDMRSALEESTGRLTCWA
jgi:hypothetical protein